MNNKIIITCLGLLQDRQSLVMYFLTNAKKNCTINTKRYYSLVANKRKKYKFKKWPLLKLREVKIDPCCYSLT